MDLINWSLSAIDTIFSTRSLGSGEPVCPDGTFAAGYTRDAWEKWQIVCLAALSVEDAEDIYLFGIMITGIAVWIRLYPGLSKNSEDGNSCSKSHKAARFDWSCGKSGQQWDWDYKPEYGYHHDETRCFGSEIWWFQRSEWTKRMSCGNFAAVRPKSHNNLILSFWLPVPAPWPRPSGFTTLRERCSEDSLAPFPHYRHYSPPPFNCLWKCFVPPLGRAGLRPAPQWHWTGWLLARAGYVPHVAMSCVLWYMCFCAEVFFFCSQTVLQMEHSLGVKNFFFLLSLLM